MVLGLRCGSDVNESWIPFASNTVDVHTPTPSSSIPTANVDTLENGASRRRKHYAHNALLQSNAASTP